MSTKRDTRQHDAVIIFRLPQALRTELERLAGKDGISACAREILARHLEKKSRKAA